jgi:hypothetical protein
MPVPYIKLEEMIIKDKGKNTDVPGRVEVPPGIDIRQVPDLCVIYNVLKIVEMEGTAK